MMMPSVSNNVGPLPVGTMTQQGPVGTMTHQQGPVGRISPMGNSGVLQSPGGTLRHIGPMPPSHVGGKMDSTCASSFNTYEDDIYESPLLEELEINVSLITRRMKSVFTMQTIDHETMAETDLCGPLLIGLALGICMLFTGKIHFGYIYGLGIIGCVGMFMILNVMSQKDSIDLYMTLSILGYGLLPVVILAAIAVFISLRNVTGCVVAPVCVCWSTATASRFFESALNMEHQRFLVAYPVLLLYASFVLLTVF
eukprot:GHVR01111648.1.p1 GENE.GHVR01111648.1~~GHVR01111648.1.p1  ORF type:complete len:264 (+),score=37.40 GHVR01111648.1:33-794(+)